MFPAEMTLCMLLISCPVAAELDNIEKWAKKRGIPKKDPGRILIAKWNLTNFGVQKRGDDHLRMMAKIIGLFDVVAVQEIADDLTHLRKLLGFLGGNWDNVYSDIGGNAERLGFIYNSTKVSRKNLDAELVVKGDFSLEVVTDGKKKTYSDFNLNPYMVDFAAGGFEFTLVNVHLYQALEIVRAQEASAVSKWAAGRSDKKYPPCEDIIVLGDFNMNRWNMSDATYKELVAHGLSVPEHTTEFASGSSLSGEAFYDAVTFVSKKTTADCSGQDGVFDFDNAVFPTEWKKLKTESERATFKDYLRYYLSDHRPLWREFKA